MLDHSIVQNMPLNRKPIRNVFGEFTEEFKSGIDDAVQSAHDAIDKMVAAGYSAEEVVGAISALMAYVASSKEQLRSIRAKEAFSTTNQLFEAVKKEVDAAGIMGLTYTERSTILQKLTDKAQMLLDYGHSLMLSDGTVVQSLKVDGNPTVVALVGFTPSGDMKMELVAA